MRQASQGAETAKRPSGTLAKAAALFALCALASGCVTPSLYDRSVEPFSLLAPGSLAYIRLAKGPLEEFAPAPPPLGNGIPGTARSLIGRFRQISPCWRTERDTRPSSLARAILSGRRPWRLRETQPGRGKESAIATPRPACRSPCQAPMSSSRHPEALRRLRAGSRPTARRPCRPSFPSYAIERSSSGRPTRSGGSPSSSGARPWTYPARASSCRRAGPDPRLATRTARTARTARRKSPYTRPPSSSLWRIPSPPGSIGRPRGSPTFALIHALSPEDAEALPRFGLSDNAIVSESFRIRSSAIAAALRALAQPSSPAAPAKD